MNIRRRSSATRSAHESQVPPIVSPEPHGVKRGIRERHFLSGNDKLSVGGRI